jgi:hypothetical protein
MSASPGISSSRMSGPQTLIDKLWSAHTPPPAASVFSASAIRARFRPRVACNIAACKNQDHSVSYYLTAELSPRFSGDIMLSIIDEKEDDIEDI